MVPVAPIDVQAVVMALITFVATFAVCRWRIADLERRVEKLESVERNHSDRMVAVETKLESCIKILEKIAEKLHVD